MSKTGIDARHCKWPLGTTVHVKTPAGYLLGTISKHDRSLPNGCWVDFDIAFSWRYPEHQGYGHIVPFRSMRPHYRVRLKRPWYREEPYAQLTRRGR
ncbi:hypothetical protein [uncultured Pseudomonas sp.]|uniref:hypothetical protein n=1 Tax=uncultured Pseudomonas sp. TaxID=114707 RepID=UPI0025E78985|nr:hypothetical protein [uncultured Pseudomonas sp.]